MENKREKKEIIYCVKKIRDFYFIKKNLNRLILANSAQFYIPKPVYPLKKFFFAIKNRKILDSRQRVKFKNINIESKKRITGKKRKRDDSRQENTKLPFKKRFKNVNYRISNNNF